MLSNTSSLRVIVGPIIRQVVQWASGAALGVGVVTDSDLTTATGAIMSLLNIAFVVRARVKAGS